jgi:outer membrane protein OmpA-like peptidoglycan-associated protein
MAKDIFMLQYHKSIQRISALLLALLVTGLSVHSQRTSRTAIIPVEPTWWFGFSTAANLNFYRGTTQKLNEELTVPTAFHKGNGIKPYFSLLTEYRPNKVLGGMLNVAFDNRGGKFDGVMAPCDCPADLSTNISYLAIEPSLRIAPFSNSFYIFGGPTMNFNLAKSFTYKQDKQPDRKGEWSDVKNSTFSAQLGAGIDIPISKPTSATQMTLSPFASFLTDLGRAPRSAESWSFYTVRAGVAFKFGKAKKRAAVVVPADPANVIVPTAVEKEVMFSVRAPQTVTANRQVKETFALRNSVFFDQGVATIPGRYTQLNKDQALLFKEDQLQEEQPDNLNKGRSARQMAVYYNILNIIGDRMRDNGQSRIKLSGAADNNPAEGKLMADNIKQYLVTNFGIAASRITTEGRSKPVIPSEQPGATKELDLLRAGDRRVDIVSTSPEMLMQVGGSSSPFLKPVHIKTSQQDPLNGQVLFTVTGATEILSSWNVEVKDEKGIVQYYGPYTADQASISGSTILGNNTQGNYAISMLGTTKAGNPVRKEAAVSFMKSDEAAQEGLRYSILFDFDQSKTIASYEKFLTDIVTPLIKGNSTVTIHGHTDIIGDEMYNHTLSEERVMSTQQIIEKALAKAGKKGVKFESQGFGEDTNRTPFENNFPEERFYNRTVIIDIMPGK